MIRNCEKTTTINWLVLTSSVLALFLGACSNSADKGELDTSSQPAIFGGTEVGSRDPVAHSTVAVQVRSSNSGAFCTGVLISPTEVLTAGHCFNENSLSASLVFHTDARRILATSENSEARQKFVRLSVKFEVHPVYKLFRTFTDQNIEYKTLSVLQAAAYKRCQTDEERNEVSSEFNKKFKALFERLTTSIANSQLRRQVYAALFTGRSRYDAAYIRFSGTLPPGYVPTATMGSSATSRPPNGAHSEITLAGFGSTNPESNDGSEGVGILRTARVSIEDFNFSDSEFLINQSQGQGVWMGDSGGPAFAPQGQGLALLGLSGRTLSDSERYFTIYTKISSLTDWLYSAHQAP